MNEKASVAEIKTLDEDEKLRGYSETLHNLRKDGVKKIADLKQEIRLPLKTFSDYNFLLVSAAKRTYKLIS